jgi:hypothetical protein
MATNCRLVATLMMFVPNYQQTRAAGHEWTKNVRFWKKLFGRPSTNEHNSPYWKCPFRAMAYSCTASLVLVSLMPTASHGQGNAPSPAATNGVATTRAGDKQFGITFLVPKGIDLYSVTNPGPLSSQISAKEPFILVRPAFHDENINVKVADGVTESDLKAMKDQLDSNPNMPLPGYKRIGVRNTNVGKNGAIKAVEHDFQMQGNVLGRMRSITFVIGSRGFILTCGTSVDRFDDANKTFFQPFLDSIEPAK